MGVSSGCGGRQIHFGTWRDRCVQRGAEAGVCSPAAAATGAINWTGHLGDTLACCWRLMGTGVMGRRPGLQAWGGPQVRGLRLQARPGPLARAEPYSCLAWQGGRALVPQPPPGRGHQEAGTAGRRGSPPRCPSGRKGTETTRIGPLRNLFGVLWPEKGVRGAGGGRNYHPQNMCTGHS